MKKTLFSLLLLALLAVSCSPKPGNPLAGAPYKRITAFPVEKQLTGACLDTVPIGAIWVYPVDTFLIYKIKNQPKMWSVWDKRTLKHRVDLWSQGNAPTEIVSLAYMRQYFVRDTGIVVPVLDINRRRVLELDLTASVEKGEEVLVDTSLVRLEKMCFKVFKHTDSTWIGVSPDFGAQKMVCLEIDGKTGKATGKEYAALTGLASPNDLMFLSAEYALRPGGDKIASAMTSLNQLNIIDLEHPEKTCSVVYGKYTDAKALLEEKSMKDRIQYYNDVVVTDSLIYALYLNMPSNEHVEENTHVEIHVLDWEGHPKVLYRLDSIPGASSLAIDEQGENLYVRCAGGEREESVYKCALNG